MYLEIALGFLFSFFGPSFTQASFWLWHPDTGLLEQEAFKSWLKQYNWKGKAMSVDDMSLVFFFCHQCILSPGFAEGKHAEGNTLHFTIWNKSPNFLPNVFSTKQIVSQFSVLRLPEDSEEILSLKNLTQDSNLCAVYSSIIKHSRSELLTVPSWHPFIQDKTCLVQTYIENFLQINMICMQLLSGGDQGQVCTDRHWLYSDQVDSPVGKF